MSLHGAERKIHDSPLLGEPRTHAIHSENVLRDRKLLRQVVVLLEVDLAVCLKGLLPELDYPLVIRLLLRSVAVFYLRTDHDEVKRRELIEVQFLKH